MFKIWINSEENGNDWCKKINVWGRKTKNIETYWELKQNDIFSKKLKSKLTKKLKFRIRIKSVIRNKRLGIRIK